MVKVRFWVYLLHLLRSTKPSLLHSRRALLLLLRHRWRMNKFSNFKIHRRFYSQAQSTA